MFKKHERYSNYFIVDNVKYYTGTVFVMQRESSKPIEATFICYDNQIQKYCFQPHNSNCKRHWADHYTMNEWFVCVTDKIDTTARMPVERTFNDRFIEWLPLGWCWYIFLMALSILFKDCIGLWILISVVFFSWRHNKIKKEGTYYEW